MIKSRRLIWAGNVVRIEGRNAFTILTDTPTRKRILRRPRWRWEDNVRKDLREIGVSARDWDDSAQDTDYWRILVNYTSNLYI